MDFPLVTVICLCYNHERFVKEAVESVLSQTYPSIQIIIVDDASTDNSRNVIDEIARQNSQIEYLPLGKNIGNCAAFNRGLRLAKGKFVVDFATDDVMLPNRIARQVETFQQLDQSWGVVFSDAEYVDQNGKHLYQYYPYLRKKRIIDHVPTGDVFEALIKRYFISGPTMLVRREVFDYLEGYDESLAYEDFDFWIRSSRKFKYAFIDEVLTKVRKHSGSLSTKLYTKDDLQIHSTYKVLLKAKQLAFKPSEVVALQQRVRYEHRHAALTGLKKESNLLFELLKELNGVDLSSRMLHTALRLNVPVSGIRKLYHQIKYGMR